MKSTIKKIFGIIFFMLVMAFFVNAQHAPQITITKTTPAEIDFGEILEVRIEVASSYNESLDITLKEIVDFAEPLDKENLIQEQNITQTENETIINGITWLKLDGKCEFGCKKDDKICDPDCKCTAIEDMDCAAFFISIPPRYEWTFTLNSGETKGISYRVKPYKIGFIGIPKTVAETKIGKFYSNELKVRVKCKIDGICSKDENFGNCPEDCKSGGSDNYCDGAADGICDPNCPKYADPDCIAAKCGDKNCEKEKGETYENCPEDCERPIICGDNLCYNGENFATCPQDCKSGGSDNYCDGLRDYICDPDCARNLDPDCLCNNNNVCEIGFENFANCQEDCPSGLKDNYCDKMGDGKCDPDCLQSDDPDCRADYLLYIVLFIIILLAVFFVYRKLKERNEEYE